MLIWLKLAVLLRPYTCKVILCCQFCFTSQRVLTGRLEDPFSDLLEGHVLLVCIIVVIRELPTRVTAINLVALPEQIKLGLAV